MKSAFLSMAILFCIFLLHATTAPVVSNMTAAQRTDGSYIIDIYYDVYDADGDILTISLQVSDDNGLTWNVPCTMVSGDIGTNINQGNNKHIVWNLGLEHPMTSSNFSFKVSADDGYEPPPLPANFVLVQSGTFHNGSSNVTLSTFYIDKYEVTQASYQAVMGGALPTFPNRPRASVSWFKAVEYCNRRSMQEGLTPCYSYSSFGTNPSNWPSGWSTSNANHTNLSCNWSANGYRLPTEMEWLFAAKGGNHSQGYIYSGSNTVGAVAWYNGNAGSRTHDVGELAANEIGTFDMSGNVWEWCWDMTDWPLAPFPSDDQTDPTGPESGAQRVALGGCWYNPAIVSTLTYRSYNVFATSSHTNVGFRIVRRFP
ncbi:MAG: SUMF1/EgtB/PvdO family nonheme iron enzyme [Candidatus Cloacimonadaceae bacterium]|nr:SUMF1/EgtB/PvdO family nonheme iron enzyme [Candidatus Cloacimonadaceae bacterium]